MPARVVRTQRDRLLRTASFKASSFVVFAFAVALAVAPAHAGSPAARVGHATNHGGLVQEGSLNVVIGGQLAARVGDRAGCPLTCGPGVPHLGGPIASGSSTVSINGRAAAFLGSAVAEACSASVIVGGVSTVLIGP